MPIGRRTFPDLPLLVALAFSLAAVPGLCLAQQAPAPTQAAAAPAGPETPDQGMDQDGAEASPPSLDDPGPLRPVTAEDERIYNDHVRTAFVAAQSQQGPLEGAWQILDAQGRPVLKLELVDEKAGDLSGAWFDPNAAAGKDASGLIDDMVRQAGGGFTAHILQPQSAQLLSLDLKPSLNGQLTGALNQPGRQETVVMKRDPASLGAAESFSGSAQPYNPAAAGSAAKAPAKKPVRRKPPVKKAPVKKPAAKAPAKPAAKAPAKPAAKAPVKK